MILKFTLRIRLRAIGRARHVQGNGLVADNVVAGRRLGGDGDGSGDVRDERVRGLGARDRARDPAPSVHLGVVLSTVMQSVPQLAM